MVEPLQAFTFRAYRAIGFPANHSPSPGALLYSVEYDGRSIFYGTDTATLLETTWQALGEFGIQFNAVILDHTYGPDQLGTDHLSAQQFIDHADRMRNEGMLQPNARIFATHLAHEGNPAHTELEEYARQNGYEIAFDGLILEI